jgi:Uma2 family endonuclease
LAHAIDIDEKPYTEILAGRLVRKVSPKRAHALLQPHIAGLVKRLAGDRGDVGTEWRFYMNPPGDARTSLVPDVAFVSNERIYALPPPLREEPPLSPDIAIEIRSPGDRIRVVEWKMHAYLEMGGKLALDVLPDTREIRVFTCAETRTFHTGDRFESDEFPWLVFDVAEVFAVLG